MMITLHGDRGNKKRKRRLKTYPSTTLSAASSFRCLGETVWVRGFFAADLVASFHVCCKCACRRTCAHIASHGP